MTDEEFYHLGSKVTNVPTYLTYILRVIKYGSFNWPSEMWLKKGQNENCEKKSINVFKNEEKKKILLCCTILGST